MDRELQDRSIDIEPNSKPLLLKRIISDGFDTVLVFLLFMIFSAVVFSTPLARVYNEHYENYKKVQDSVIEEYGNDAEAINESLRNNAYYLDEQFAANLHGYLLKALAGFLSLSAVVLVVPLVSPTRGTPGKLMTRIMPFSERKRTRASRGSIVARFLFIFFIESLFLYLFTGVYTFLLVPVIRLIEILLNKKNKTICDAISGVMIIENLSYDGIEKIEKSRFNR